MSDNVVVCGAGFAGFNAALTLDKLGFDVILLDENHYHLYRPGLVDLFRGNLTVDDLKIDLDKFYRGTSVEFSAERVERIYPDNNVVKAEIGEYSFDYCVVCLGGEYKVPEKDFVFSSCSLNDVQESIEYIEENDVEKVAIVGGGYVGVEVAAELDLMDIEVTVIDSNTRPLSNFNEDVSHKVLDYFNKHDINFRGGFRAADVIDGGVKLSNGVYVDSDMVLWNTGVSASNIVQESFNVGNNGVPVNEGLCSEEYSNIFVLGDCSESDEVRSDQIALKQGRFVGKNIKKGNDEMLESFKPGYSPFIISLGKTGVYTNDDTVYKSRIFRWMKEIIRIKYQKGLKLRKML